MDRPVYRSLAESFRLDIYLPECGLIAPPVSTCRADERLEEVMSGDRPPQSVFIDLTGGKTLETVMPVIRGRAVPIVYFDSPEAGEAAARFAKENNIGDMTLCAPYEKREALAAIREMLPLSRGMLDLRGRKTPEPVELIGQCQSHQATMLLMNAGTDRALIRSLLKRFIQVWVEDEGNLAEAVLTGACGMDALTERLTRLVIDVASGTESRAEALGHAEYFIPYKYQDKTIASERNCEKEA